MPHQTATGAPTRARSPRLILSEDGYVRLTPEDLLATPLVHLLSGLDEDNLPSSRVGASFAPIAGYTEWVSATRPVITLGWDWRLEVSQTYPFYARWGVPRSNIMLVDTRQRDLGPVQTAALLETAIDVLAWQAEIHDYITTRYA